jgi:hypothetical protein
VALTDKPIQGETPLTDQDLQGLKLPFVKTRAQLSEVEGQNIISGKQWALRSKFTNTCNAFAGVHAGAASKDVQ